MPFKGIRKSLAGELARIFTRKRFLKGFWEALLPGASSGVRIDVPILAANAMT